MQAVVLRPSVPTLPQYLSLNFRAFTLLLGGEVTVIGPVVKARSDIPDERLAPPSPQSRDDRLYTGCRHPSRKRQRQSALIPICRMKAGPTPLFSYIVSIFIFYQFVVCSVIPLPVTFLREDFITIVLRNLIAIFFSSYVSL